MSSSSVGMTQTRTLLSGVESSTSCPLELFFCSSNCMPRKVSPLRICARIYGSFSPIPPVKTMISTPSIAAAYAPIYFLTL